VPIHLPPRKYQTKKDNHLFEKKLKQKKLAPIVKPMKIEIKKRKDNQQPQFGG
jgi:hypothetical protein